MKTDHKTLAITHIVLALILAAIMIFGDKLVAPGWVQDNWLSVCLVAWIVVSNLATHILGRNGKA